MASWRRPSSASTAYPPVPETQHVEVKPTCYPQASHIGTAFGKLIYLSLVQGLTKAGNLLFSVDGSPSTWATFTWIKLPPSFSCFLRVQQFEGSNCHECLTWHPKQDWNYGQVTSARWHIPNHQPAYVTLRSSLNLSGLPFICKRRELSWYFPKILSSSTIWWSSCNHFTLLRKGNVSATSQRQFQLTSAVFLQK